MPFRKSAKIELVTTARSRPVTSCAADALLQLRDVSDGWQGIKGRRLFPRELAAGGLLLGKRDYLALEAMDGGSSSVECHDASAGSRRLSSGSEREILR